MMRRCRGRERQVEKLAERRVGIVREEVRLQKGGGLKPCNIKKMRRKDSGLTSATEKNYTRWQEQRVERRTSFLHDLPISVLNHAGSTVSQPQCIRG